MKTLLNIAFRNLRRQKKRSALLAGAIGFGVFIVTLVSSLAGSLQVNIAGNISELYSGHLFIEGVRRDGDAKPVTVLQDTPELLGAVEAAGYSLEATARRSAAAATIVFQGRKLLQTLYGVNLEQESGLRERVLLVDGSWDNFAWPNAIILAESTVKKLNIQVGDRFDITLKTVNGQNNLGSAVLAAVCEDVGFSGGTLAWADRAWLNALLDMGANDYQLFGIRLQRVGRSEREASILADALEAAGLGVFRLERGQEPSASQSRYQKLASLAKQEQWKGTKYRVFTINDMISQIGAIANALESASLVLLIVLFVVIMVGLSNTFRMAVHERTRETGTMRALGMRRSGVWTLFVFEAALLAAAGTLAGWAAAAIIASLLSLIPFGTDTVLSLFMRAGHLSFLPNPLLSLGHFLLIEALTIVSVLGPAISAARMDCAKALRSSK